MLWNLLKIIRQIVCQIKQIPFYPLNEQLVFYVCSLNKLKLHEKKLLTIVRKKLITYRGIKRQKSLEKHLKCYICKFYVSKIRKIISPALQAQNTCRPIIYLIFGHEVAPSENVPQVELPWSSMLPAKSFDNAMLVNLHAQKIGKNFPIQFKAIIYTKLTNSAFSHMQSNSKDIIVNFFSHKAI